MYRWTEHGSHIELTVDDESPEALFAETMVAVGDVLAEAREGDPVTHRIDLSAGDVGELLGAWLAELVRLAEEDGFVAQHLVAFELQGPTLRAVVGGEGAVPRARIKPATFERAEIDRSGGGWRARVLLSG